MRRFIWTTVGCTIFFSSLLAQGSQPYRKKVVSFIDDVVVAGKFELTTEQRGYIKRALRQSINFERFTYAPLPDTVVAPFSRNLALVQLTPEGLKPLIDSTLAPELLKILDVRKELLSRQNLTEAERNSFLALKAKAAGLTAQQLEQILNSGFFYIPYVELYERRIEKRMREVKNEKGKMVKIPVIEYTHELQLGLLWYKLNVGMDNKISVSFAGKASGWKGSPIVRTGSHDEVDIRGNRLSDDGSEDREAFRTAVGMSCYNIQLETKKMESFMLSGEVTEASFLGVRLNLGTKEGVGLDDTYWVEEFEETESGDLIKTRRGFVKIRSVADNAVDETAQSYAQTITGSDYSTGLTVTEVPLLGINGLLSVTRFPVGLSTFDNVPRGFLKTTDKNYRYNFGVAITSDLSTVYGAALSLQTDLANKTRISEFWAHLGGGIGLADVDGRFFIPKFSSGGGMDSVDLGVSLTGFVNLGVVKKFYFRRFGFITQADVKYAILYLTGKGKDDKNKDVTYEISHDQIGADVKGGVELYITPVLSFGAGAEYNLFPAGDSWTATVTDSDKNDIARNSGVVGPQVRFGGVAVSIWMNYSLPSLQ